MCAWNEGGIHTSRIDSQNPEKGSSIFDLFHTDWKWTISEQLPCHQLVSLLNSVMSSKQNWWVYWWLKQSRLYLKFKLLCKLSSFSMKCISLVLSFWPTREHAGSSSSSADGMLSIFVSAHSAFALKKCLFSQASVDVFDI